MLTDVPIRCRRDDLFGRAPLAAQIAAEAVTAPIDSGFVAAINGPWGSGKSSVANLVAEKIQEDGTAFVMEFNPWLFSGASDLVGRFFEELGGALGRESHNRSLKQLSESLSKYGSALAAVVSVVPIVGMVGGAALEAAARIGGSDRSKKSPQVMQAEVTDALLEAEQRIVVIIDDLDRLSDEEIREIVRLVKLVGDLPWLSYILCYDRIRVEEAVGSGLTASESSENVRLSGRHFLEKIVQARHDVPVLRSSVLSQFCFDRLDEALEPFGDIVLHERDWGNIVGFALRTYLKNPRDVKRYVNAIPPTLRILDDEVALVDVLGLKALHVFDPDVHSALPGIADILNGTRLRLGDEERHRQEEKDTIEGVLKQARYPEASARLLGQLFPAASGSLGVSVRGVQPERIERRDRRVSQRGPLDTYLHSSLDKDVLATGEVMQIIRVLGDADELKTRLDAYEGARLVDLVDRLSDFEDEFDSETALEAALIFLGVEQRMSPDESPFFTGRAPASWKLHWLVGKLLLAVSEDSRAEIARQLVQRTPTLSQRLRALNWFGTFPERKERDPDAEMISSDESQRLRDELRGLVTESSNPALAEEPMLRELLWGLLYPDEEAGRQVVREKIADDNLFIALLVASYSTVLSQGLEESVGTRTRQLDWWGLASLIGEDELRERLLALEQGDFSHHSEAEQQVLTAAIQIASGQVDPPRKL